MSCVEIRNMNCELGPLSRPDGSALFTLGETITLSAVYGPVEVKPQKLLIENATIEVSFRPKVGLPGVADKLKEATLTSICKTAILSSQHPRTSISVIVQEMQDSGGLLACSINCACLALVNAGVPLKFLVAAINCMINNHDEIILDPNHVQLKMYQYFFVTSFNRSKINSIVKGRSLDNTKIDNDGESKANFTLVFDGINKDVVASETSGTFTRKQFEEVLATCREASSSVFQFYHKVIKKLTNG